MAEIFFSYSSKDRERVRPVRDTPVAQGFDVFWDQAVPAGGADHGLIGSLLKITTTARTCPVTAAMIGDRP